MAKHLFMFMTDAVEGRDAEFNAWYETQHLADVIRVAGFSAARRYRLADTDHAPPGEQRYMAGYEIDTDDPAAVFAKLMAAAGSPDLPLSDALDMKNMKILIWEQTSERTA